MPRILSRKHSRDRNIFYPFLRRRPTLARLLRSKPTAFNPPYYFHIPPSKIFETRPKVLGRRHVGSIYPANTQTTRVHFLFFKSNSHKRPRYGRKRSGAEVYEIQQTAAHITSERFLTPSRANSICKMNRHIENNRVDSEEQLRKALETIRVNEDVEPCQNRAWSFWDCYRMYGTFFWRVSGL